jgi:hypothetical protein
MAARLSAALWISRRGVLPVLGGVCIAGWGLRSALAQEATQIRIQLDQQALNTVPGRERASLEVTEEYISRGTSPEGTQPAGQSDPNYLSDRWLVVASLDLVGGTRDASAPRVWRGGHRHAHDSREHSSRPICTS